MAKIILRAGKVAIKIILPFAILGLIFYSIKMLTPARAQIEPEQSALADELALAETYQEQGHYAEAEQIYQGIIERYPLTDYDFEAQKQLTILYINWDKPADADAALEQLTSSFYGHPDIARAVCDIADQYYWELEKYEKARELHQHVLDNWPDSKVAILSQADIAACNIRLGDAPNAEAAIEKLLAEFSESELIAEAARNIVDEYLSLQQYEKARELCQYVLENWPSSKDTVCLQAGLAISYSGLGDNPNAQVAIDSLLADFNDHLDLPYAMFQVGEKYYMKALQLEHQGLDTEARDYFAKAIAVSEKVITELPGSTATADSYYLSAVCYRRLVEYEKAIECYQEVIDSWPDYERACSVQFSIGRCYEKLEESGDLNESEANALIEQAYRRLLESYPECGLAGKAWEKLGWLNFEKGQWAKAAGCFELSLEKYLENYRPCHILYPLGRAYEELGQLEKAGQVYNEFIQTTYPADPRIERVKARLENLDLPTNN